MKSITIHKLDSNLAKAIEGLSKTTGLSQNKVIKKLLRKALGLEGGNQVKRDLTATFDVWSKEEEKTFEETISVFSQIDSELWQ